jgi:hypothetical protein
MAAMSFSTQIHSLDICPLSSLQYTFPYPGSGRVNTKSYKSLAQDIRHNSTGIIGHMWGIFLVGAQTNYGRKPVHDYRILDTT